MRNFPTLWSAGRVTRFHTTPTHQRQNLADHSWGVAMILLQIVPAEEMSTVLLQAALTHDLAESVTGDLPYPVKLGSAALSSILDKIEGEFEDRHLIRVELNATEAHWLKWADMFELALFCKSETDMGNKAMGFMLTRAKIFLKQLGHPNQVAEDLFYEALAGT